SQEALLEAFYAAVRRNELTPVLVTSAAKAMGITLLLDFFLKGVRHVEDHAPLPVEEGEPPVLGEDQPFSARVFKTVNDPYLGKVSMRRVLAGAVKGGDVVVGATNGTGARTAHLHPPDGQDLGALKELPAGASA